MPENDKLLEMYPVQQQWQVRSEKNLWPNRLSAFMNSQLIDTDPGEKSTTLTVELSPGLTADGVFHLANSLASLFDLALGAVQMEAIDEKARRVKVTIATQADA